MGLGKTVELLACIFSHRKPDEAEISVSNGSSVPEDWKTGLKRSKRERVECICGAVIESRKYKGIWVQCDMCDAWQHAECVGYSPKGKSKKASQDVDEKASQKKSKKRCGENCCLTSHTRLGSLVTYIYEGVRNVSLSEEPMVDITELLNADIVLTTYDVLKEDLTHDCDRHDGDRQRCDW